MKINITKKNLNPGEATLQAIEKKLSKLDKYFAKDTQADVVLTNMKNNTVKLEATINADGLIFRAEEIGDDLRGCLDSVVDKLASQMSRFKKKLIKSNRKKEVVYAELPDVDTAAPEELAVAKTKTFRISPMAVEEAILQMELLEHSFFVFRHAEKNNVCVVYKRNDGSYGLLDIEN
ncbi:MAG: ribosome-associated translation inhibitor RaiA [Firmicutes bacterium]|nr:ribosome-associated translation inhibitor RaiA [Bacillota bacterium]MBQ2059101.1 ribosome-associated translation inhibitor RaiA [Bacillota bacterium]